MKAVLVDEAGRLRAGGAQPNLAARELAAHLDITPRAVEKKIHKLKEQNRLRRVGPAKGGYWGNTGMAQRSLFQTPSQPTDQGCLRPLAGANSDPGINRFDGPEWGRFGQFDRDDYAYLQVRYEF